MIKSLWVLAILIQILSFPNLSQAFYQDSNWISDLAETSIADLTLEANDWTLSNAVCPSCSKLYTIPVNNCGLSQETIFGGPNMLGPQGVSSFGQYYQRQYSGVIAASGSSGVQLDLWIFSQEILSDPEISVASWLDVSINNRVTQSQRFSLLESCQIDYTGPNGAIIKVIYKLRSQSWVTLSTSTLEFRVIQKISSPSTLSSFGFKNLKIYVFQTVGYSPINPTNFPCMSKQYWDGSSTTCSSCSTDCWACTGPLPADCIACGVYMHQNKTCSGSCYGPFVEFRSLGYYYCKKRCTTGYYWGYESCRADCPTPLQPRIDENGFDVCVNPCGSRFLYPDGSCSSSCSSPRFAVKDSIYCVSPCESTTNLSFLNGTCTSTCDTPFVTSSEKGIPNCLAPCANKYLYANGSCLSNCEAPLVQILTFDIKYCINPCTDPVNQYLYPNGTCSSDCPLPLLSRTEPAAKFCWNPCPAGTPFLYPNSACGMSCNPPLAQRSEPAGKYCFNPCSDPSQYLYSNGSCSSDCPSPLFSRTEPAAKFCWNPCSTGTPFLYPNSTCGVSCNPPLVQRSEPAGKYCFNPCSDPSQYLYSNGSCSSDCPSPLFSRTEPAAKFCWNPCPTGTPFLYPNSTCGMSCNPPLVQRSEPAGKYCFNPCPDPNDYLYSDKTCSSQCLYPLSQRIEPGAKYCFSPCDDGLYFYKSGSCLPACNAPYIKSELYNVHQCLPPCEDPNNGYFYEADKTCKPTCNPPDESKTIDGVKICSQKAQTTDNEEAEKIASSIEAQAKVTDTGMKAVSAMSSGSPNLSWLAGQAAILFYIRYINITYTAKLRRVFLLQDVNPFDFTIEVEMPKGLQEKLKNRDLPEVFERYEINSNFVSNSWDMLCSLLLVMGIILMVSAVKMFTRKYRRIDKILALMLASLKWNTLLMVILGSFGKLYFDVSMQFQATSVDSAWDAVSIGLAIIMLLIGVAILALNGKILSDLWKSRHVKSSLEEKEGKWRNFELFFENYKRNSLASFACMAIFLGRALIFNLIIANLYKYPLLQSVLINVITLGMAGYLAIKRPMKSKLEFVQILLNEILLVIVNICTLIIAIMDKAGIKGKELRIDVCNTIITIIYMFTSLSLAFLVIQILVALAFFVKILKRLKVRNQLNPRSILNALIFDEKEEIVGTQLEKNNVVQIHPQGKSMKESELHTTEEINITDSTIPQMNETEPGQESIGVFAPSKYSKRRYIRGRRNNDQNLSYLDRSSVEMIPTEGSSFHHHPLGISTDLFSGRSRGLTLESNGRDSVAFSNDLLRDSVAVEEKKEGSLPGTIAQFRKMRNYMRRNQDRKDQK